MTLCLAAFGAPFAQAQILTGYSADYNEERAEDSGSFTASEPTNTNAGAVEAYQPWLTVKNGAASDEAGAAAIKPLPPKMPEEPVDGEQEPVDLTADQLMHDEEKGIITASGDVMMVQAGRILRADEISYNLKTDTVQARGHVVLNEENGDIHTADEVEFNNKMKNGFVEGLITYLNDGARFTARRGTREGGTVTTMQDAAYTPCEPCKDDPGRPPVWQITAGKVIHDEEDNMIKYRDARFEVYGVPVAYTPYFAHPDGSVKRKSGFLSPSAGFDSELGGFVTNEYYWDIAPEKDATAGLMVMTEELPMLTGQWRQRWRDAAAEIEGGITYSSRTENQNGVNSTVDEEVRGYVFTESLWNINNKWRSGANIQWASDDQFLRQYDLSNENVLRSSVFAERFSGRNYAAGRLLAFQDMRIEEEGEEEIDQPQVLPEIVASFLGEPGSMPVLGGRWGVDASFLGLRRSGDENQDMNRASLKAEWRRRFVSGYGMLTRVNANLRGDVYNVRDRDAAVPGSGQSGSLTAVRGFANAHIESRYPVVKHFEHMQASIEPIAAITIAPNIDVNNDIPNEDSQDAQIDASNLFEPNRFPGLDRIEDKSRLTYGVRTGLYGYGGSHGNIFLGQSYRFDEDDNPFPEGSGLNARESDIVGQISGSYRNNLDLDYRFQLSSEDLTSQRHEVDGNARWGRFSLGGRYLFAKALAGTEIDESREQLQARAAYYVTDNWRVSSGGTQDFGDNPGLRKAYAGLDYFGQCVSWSMVGERNFTNEATGESDTKILFRLGLKNLGEFQGPGLHVAGTNE